MSRYLMCDECGHRLKRVYDEWGRWDGESYFCEYCASRRYDDDDDDESLNVYEASLIWASSGKDEDMMFGFSEEELEDALKE